MEISEKIKKHKDYKEEVNHLEYAKKCLEQNIKAIELYKEKSRGNITDAFVNGGESDGSDAYLTLLINSSYLDMMDKNYYAYRKIRKKPYFARIDFKIDEDFDGKEGESVKKNEISKIYIGKASLHNIEKDEHIIVDWRSPIANVYYEGRLGRNTYSVGNDKVSGEMFLKRQYTIEDGTLKNFMDIDITTTDEFLQASLEANAENKLKDIASTIQAEQNRVIRADLNRPLIVQGVAGSGKTTIALHRIAYFIYTYEETFGPENYMIIAPSNLFLDYISAVLPELGVDKVKQTTYADFIFELIGKKYRMTDSDEKLKFFIESGDEKEKHLVEWASNFKGTMDFKDIIDNYIKEIEQNFVPEENFVIGRIVFMKNADIRKMFLEDLQDFPLERRINELKKTFKNKINRFKDKLLERLEASYDRKLDGIRRLDIDTNKKRLMLISMMNERDRKLKSTAKKLKELPDEYAAKFPSHDIFYYYYNLITDSECIESMTDVCLPKPELEYMCKHSRELLESGKIEFEDLAALGYMKSKISGFSKKLNVKNVIIDEAQDFSTFQFYALKSILNTNMFTILGDISQGIHAYRGTKNWQDMMNSVFKNDMPGYVTLQQSYRTTIEIMELANKIISLYKNDGVILAKPVIRHGDKPKIENYEDENKLLQSLSNEIDSWTKEDFKSIAVVCKTLDECKSVKKYLDSKTEIKSTILDGKQNKYNAGVVIVPSQLTKGLEFDCVFIVSLYKTYENNPLDIKLLYVCMTRALHRLNILEMNKNIKLLENIK